MVFLDCWVTLVRPFSPRTSVKSIYAEGASTIDCRRSIEMTPRSPAAVRGRRNKPAEVTYACRINEGFLRVILYQFLLR